MDLLLFNVAKCFGHRPFQSLDTKINAPTWVKVSEFVKNQLYQEVEKDFNELK